MLTPAIKHTADLHLCYRSVLAEIVDRFGIDAVMVSSLVGHSLEVFRTGLPTLMICHDYYPFCPALNVTFESVCQNCGPEELKRCTLHNPHNRFFLNVPSSEWLALRDAFRRNIVEHKVRMVAPSFSTRDLYSAHLPEFKSGFRVIPHGTRPIAPAPLRLGFDSARRLRIVLLGRLSPDKGGELLKSFVGQVAAFADLYLLGCGDHGRVFQRDAVSVIPEYQWSDLPAVLQRIEPDLGLLLSVVPETFSYTLQELFELGVPPLATRMGSFCDRIEEGVNGFLTDASSSAVLARLRAFTSDRRPLREVHEYLCTHPPRRIEEMLADYEQLLGLPDLSARAYYAVDVAAQKALGSTQDERLLAELASMAAAPADIWNGFGDRQLVVQLANARMRVKDLEKSLSWRLTAPLRWGGALALKALANGRSKGANGNSGKMRSGSGPESRRSSIHSPGAQAE
jgi:glycosyltransferase involved in cell wall biosynthesis